MTDQLSHHKKLIQMGFYIFPLQVNGKLPALDSDFSGRSVNDEAGVKRHFQDIITGEAQPFNIGISCDKFRESEALIVVDVDTKPGKLGAESLLKLELEGKLLPPTLTQITASGGLHLIYKNKIPVFQGAENVLGPGIEVRSRGGYIVGAHSTISGKEYSFKSPILPVQDAPEWLVKHLQKLEEEGKKTAVLNSDSPLDQKAAIEQALSYLRRAPKAIQGAGGDSTTFKVCAQLRDFGLTETNALQLLLDEWNGECQPPWDVHGLSQKVRSAFKYAKNKYGVESVEAQFKPIFEETVVAPERAPTKKIVEEKKAEEKSEPDLEHPFVLLNREYAFVVNGGGAHILWETTDVDGKERIEHLSIQAFNQKLANKKLNHGSGKKNQLSELWLESSVRRSYDGIVFAPGQNVDARFYNLWRGFSCKPLGKDERPTAEMKAGLDAFLEHAEKNVCNGDKKLFKWLMGYFAHIVQKPWEKPLTALVFKGRKGTGKNALINRVGNLFQKHYLVTPNRRYLTGNFNSHLENLLTFVLDEAFWSGDKATEGIVKDLITGDNHVIERKGQEPYTVKNCTRIVILGNEDWIVPATDDERRYSVFVLGEGRFQDRKFFHDMRVNLDIKGGNRLLLRYLNSINLNEIDVNDAPQTEGLLEQKLQSLTSFKRWLFNCLIEEKITHTYDLQSGEWPLEVRASTLKDSYTKFLKEKNLKNWINNELAFMRDLKKILPTITQTRRRSEDGRQTFVTLPPVEIARKYFAAHLGGEINWENAQLEERKLDFTSLI